MPIITPQPIPELLPRTQYSYGELRQLFQNIGARVVKRALQSDNYVAGISGLRINFETGTAEFTTLVSGSFIKTFAQAGVPTSENIGDIWIDTDDNNKLYRAAMVGADQIAAGEWVEVAAGVTWDELINKPTGIFQILYQATAPATGMSAGDYWIDSDDNKIYRYNGATWAEIQDDAIAQAIGAAADAQATADGKIVAYAQATIPTSTDVGDLWIDTDDSNKLYRAASIGANEIAAGEWVLMRDAGIASAIAAAATAQSTADGKIITFAQDAIPTSTDAGDLWIDTNDGNKLYRAAITGATAIGVGQWEVFRDTTIADAQATADGKIITFVQATAPTAEAVGDLWMDTDDNNKMYRWSGSEWVEYAQDYATWSKVSGTGKPANNATVGATAGTDLKDSTSAVLADNHIKNIITDTAGETINGATLPVPVYQNTADGKVYACDANDSTKIAFRGFAISNSTNGNPITVQTQGKVGGFTGLTTGTNYFVQDTVGTIGTAKGTYSILVGKATSATEIQIYNENVEGMRILFISSDNLKASADTERTNSTSSYVKKKDISVNHFGVVRVKFDLRAQPNDVTQVYGRIYVNDVAVGTERSQSSSTYTTYSEDLSGIDQGDAIQLYIKGASGSADAYCRNFRLYWDKVSVADYTVNTD